MNRINLKDNDLIVESRRHNFDDGDDSDTLKQIVIKTREPFTSQIKQQILHDQVVVNRIEMIIKKEKMKVKYMERKQPDIESESHRLHHEWVANLDRIDMFKRLLF